MSKRKVLKNRYNQDMANPNSPKAILWVVIFVLVAAALWFLVASVNNSVNQALAPLRQTNGQLGTQVAELLHPTPTILPDPVTIVHEVRTLARLETIQYSVEKVITAQENQGLFGPLFGDRLLFVAHGTVIAGIDLQKMDDGSMSVQGGVLNVTLPPAEIFVATLDNQKSYVYDRQTGLLTHGDINLETAARQAAEEQIRQAALDDGILAQAQLNAQTYLTGFLRNLGFPDVAFGGPAAVQPTP